MPPRTDDMVVTAAITKARSGRAMINGIIRISGGIGKNELSMNDTTAKAQSALGCAASDKVQSYNLRNMLGPCDHHSCRHTSRMQMVRQPPLRWIDGCHAGR